MNNIDWEQLRKDLINFYEGGFYVGGFGVAAMKAEEIKIASNEELLQEANALGINLENYTIWQRN